MSSEFYKTSGLLAFMVAWFGMLTVIFTQGRDKKKSISMHAAVSKKSFLLLAFLSPISMTLFMIFVIKYMAPTYNLPSIFVGLSVLADMGYILAAWVPAIEGRKGKVHDFLAYSATLLLIPIALILATSPNIAPLARLINGVSFVLMLSILVIMYSSKRNLPRYLYFQIAYFLGFDVGLLAAAYLS